MIVIKKKKERKKKKQKKTPKRLNCGPWRPAGPQRKIKESKKYIDLARESKNLWNIKMTVIPVVIGAFGTTQKLSKGTGGLRNQRTSRDHPNYCIIKIGQNTEKSPGYLRRLAVTQTTMKNHQLTLVWKTLQEYNYDDNKSSLLCAAVTYLITNQTKTLLFICEYMVSCGVTPSAMKYY